MRVEDYTSSDDDKPEFKTPNKSKITAEEVEKRAKEAAASKYGGSSIYTSAQDEKDHQYIWDELD